MLTLRSGASRFAREANITDSAARFTGSIPVDYDAGLGPHLFAEFAADMARRVSALNPRRVLELAAGTGIVTQKLRDAAARRELRNAVAHAIEAQLGREMPLQALVIQARRD